MARTPLTRYFLTCFSIPILGSSLSAWSEPLPPWSYHPDNAVRRVTDPQLVLQLLEQIELSPNEYKTLNLKPGVALEDLRARLVVLAFSLRPALFAGMLTPRLKHRLDEAETKVSTAYWNILRSEIHRYVTSTQGDSRHGLVIRLSDELGHWTLTRDPRTGRLRSACSARDFPALWTAEVASGALHPDLEGRASEYQKLFAARFRGQDDVEHDPFCEWALTDALLN